MRLGIKWSKRTRFVRTQKPSFSKVIVVKYRLERSVGCKEDAMPKGNLISKGLDHLRRVWP
jgi:hypothetical protein